MNLEELQKYLDDHNITFEEYMRANMITDEDRKYMMRFIGTSKMIENKDIKKIAEELRICASSWDANAKLLGNVSAEDIMYLCDYVIYDKVVDS
jgi:hypothetical protein